ncbi:D-alanine--D-alanine ligase family protein [Propioniciclava soli]|uniref:D-alanine--D-alanine ligase n=1 Tax=Propioniciclava soli TaxID=2775081 RepID=A0ABZ3CBJ8_9ACTN|nr:D-alanine--D-alanine ligase family protein [Propioniciclava soli]
MRQVSRTRVAIIFGGVSSEHDVSCLTAGGVTRAIDAERFEVVGIGITPSGRWVQVSTDEMASLAVEDGRLPRLDEDRPTAVLVPTARGGRIATLDGDTLVDARDFDVVFALLHGPFGEDGTLQGLFEMHGLRYVGAGVAASAMSMDKDLMKAGLVSAGLPTCPWVTVTAHAWAEDSARLTRRIEDNLAFPVYVKPARGGSSVGISRAAGIDELAACVEDALTWDPKVVVEQGFVGAREIELAVLDSLDGPPRVSLAGEIRMHTADAFYDYEAKYTPEGQVDLDVPADLSDALLARVQRIAARTFTAMGAEGLSRVDLFVTPDEEIFVNELNTMPGFTYLSMYPKLWEATGLAYPDLIAELIELALHRPMGLR